MGSVIKYSRPKLYPKQRRAFYNDCRYSLCEASTKAGKTHGGMSWLLEQALAGKEGHNFWWVAPVFGQAKIAYRRMKRACRKIPYKKNETELTITLPNGAVIWFKSAHKPDDLYGEDVYAVVADEASRMKEEAWWAIRSTLTATRGKFRAIGNVKGRKNWFYVLCRKAQQGEPDFHYEKITAYDAVAAGVLDAKEIEDAKAVLPDHVFKELYLAIPADDGGNPFGLKNIENLYRPLQPKGAVVAYGFDIAKSNDFAVLTGLDSGGVQAFQDRWQGPLSAGVKKVAKIVGSKRCALDATGLGIMPAEVLQAQGDNFIAYTFSQASKQLLMEMLAVAIQSGEIIITDETTRDELLEFEYEYTRTGVRYSAPEGFHDDCVMALALANYARSNRAAAEWSFGTT